MPSASLNVPHGKQEFLYSCVPACARMVLAFFGSHHSEAELRALKRTDPNGTPVRRLTELPYLGFDVDFVTTDVVVAACLNAQGKVAEALPLVRKGLLINEKVLGLDHTQTAASYNNVAYCLWQQDRRNEAVLLWQQSLRGQEAARAMRADTGFDRAQGGMYDLSVHATLAVGLAQLKQPRNAFRHAEASLARGLLETSQVSPRTNAIALPICASRWRNANRSWHRSPHAPS